jgi:hypothetical protein
MPGEAKPNSVTENTASLALDLSRRDFVATASVAAGGFALAQGSARAATIHADIANLPPYGNGTLPPGSNLNIYTSARFPLMPRRESDRVVGALMPGNAGGAKGPDF